VTTSEPSRRTPIVRQPAFVGLMLFALVLRGPFVVVSTVSTDLREDLQLSATAIGLLTSLPVLCFGLAAPGASRLIGRIGVERSILLSLAGVFAGVLVRSAGGIALAVVGTVLIGVAITIGNVVSPVLIGRDFRRQTAAVTGSYTAALNLGSMITLSAGGALLDAWGWRGTLAVWAVLPVIAAAMWIPLARRRAAQPAPARPVTADQPAVPIGTLLRRPTTWMLTLAFTGQAFAYFGLTAWLPTLLADEQGMSRAGASAASSVFQICAVIGAFATPVLINRTGGPFIAFLVNGVLWISLPIGLLVNSDLWLLWSALGGIAQGGGFTAVFTVVVLRATSLRENRQLSAVVQTGGYVIACVGPVVIGGLHESTGSWTTPLLAAAASLAVLTVLGAASSRGLRR
jgi:CP family cyanate transporter-like MFS transporter